MLAIRLTEVKDLPWQAAMLRDRIKALAPEAGDGRFDLDAQRTALARGKENDAVCENLKHLESEMERLGVVDPAKLKKAQGQGQEFTLWPPSR